MALLAGLGLVTYAITHPGPVAATATPADHMVPAQHASWVTRDGREIPGWWIPGRTGAPAILLAPGYGMGYGDGLSLAAQLRERGFNVLIYEPRGSSPARSASALGLDEPADMIAAVDFLRSRRDIDPSGVGIWGVDVAGRAALTIAASRPDVRAVAADSAFDRVGDFLRLRVGEVTGLKNQALEFACALLFRVYRLAPAEALSSEIPIAALANRPVLFLRGDNRAELGDLTAAIYNRLQPRKELVTLRVARTRGMSADDLRAYDRHVTKFFELNVPAKRGAAH